MAYVWNTDTGESSSVRRTEGGALCFLKVSDSFLYLVLPRRPGGGLLWALLPHGPPRGLLPPAWKHGGFLRLRPEPARPRVPVRSQRWRWCPAVPITSRLCSDYWLPCWGCPVLCHAVSQLEMHNAKTVSAASRSASLDDKSFRNTPNTDTPVTSALDQFAQTTRLAIKMQNVKEQLDSVLVSARLPFAFQLGWIVTVHAYQTCFFYFNVSQESHRRSSASGYIFEPGSSGVFPSVFTCCVAAPPICTLRHSAVLCSQIKQSSLRREGVWPRNPVQWVLTSNTPLFSQVHWG